MDNGAGDQLAALIARAAHASGSLVHFVDGELLRIYGGHGLLVPWAQVGDTLLQDSLAGLIVADGQPLIINDLATDPRVPASSPVRRLGLTGAYLGQPIRDGSGAVLGICCALETQPREWSADDVAAVGDAARLGTLLITEQQGRQEVDRQRRFLDAVLDNLHDGVTACDADGRIVLVNARMQRLWGGPRMTAGLSDNAAAARPTDGNGKPNATGNTATTEPTDRNNQPTTTSNTTTTEPTDRNNQPTTTTKEPSGRDGRSVGNGDAALTDGDGQPVASGDVALFRALRGERLRNEELVFQGRGRRTRYYLIDAQPILGPGGETVGAVQAVQDVTRQRRAERFRTCELAVVTALAAAPTVEAAGPRVLEAVVGTLGWTHAELWLVDDAAGVVRSAASWHSPSWQADIEVPAELPYGTGLAGRSWQAGKPLWIRDVGRPQSLISPETAASSQLHTALAIPVRNGLEPLGVLTAFAETIEDPEDELVALMSGISAQIAQFIERRLVEDLQRQLIRTKNEYLALIGHELRTPLTSIAAYTELLRDADAETLVADGPRLLEVIDRNSTQLRHIINELLELSALDTGHAAVQLTPINLVEVIRESVTRTRDAVTGEPVSIVDELPAELVLPGDRRRLRQVVDNLLGNAVKYSPDGGRITVRLRTVGRAAELAVSDTGIGVSQEEREKMFTGLYRTSRARDRAIPGTGLGLTLSRAVVQRHHGSIELSEHEGPGTTVLVRLPLDAR
ncbi:ATP-binding protein [Actinoplanes sp. ATCC 53533]|uniref:ATP-binding protein n=1 Tax=Actinoplanes sp. ATCC 53533 TaxID=1288362 RepID=UPI001F2CE1F1|nr:ATP-binding protein [Actinoplanes sp. ATCC 53533]